MTSHEFRTPLATILSSAELMRHYGDRLPADEKDEVLASIESAVQRMTTMLERVLLIGKSDAQLLQCKPAPVDMAALCESVAQHVRTTWAQAKARLEVSCDTPARATLLDEKLVRHILENLVGNGIKYSPEGGTVRLDVRHSEGLWTVQVSDQGIGIPSSELPHLFESFHRASNVGNIQGTGLGLSIVKKAVDAHGGQISARSEAGQGSIFTVTLPLQLAP